MQGVSDMTGEENPVVLLNRVREALQMTSMVDPDGPTPFSIKYLAHQIDTCQLLTLQVCHIN